MELNRRVAARSGNLKLYLNDYVGNQLNVHSTAYAVCMAAQPRQHIAEYNDK